jgi:HSP20 family molecular chaperone IbpA
MTAIQDSIYLKNIKNLEDFMVKNIDVVIEKIDNEFKINESNLNNKINKIHDFPKIIDNNYIIKADLSGFKKEQIIIKLTDNILTIKCFDKKSNENGKYAISYSFLKSYNIPVNFNKKEIRGSLKNNVLKVIIPIIA